MSNPVVFIDDNYPLHAPFSIDTANVEWSLNGTDWSVVTTYSPTQGTYSAFAAAAINPPAAVDNKANAFIRFSYDSSHEALLWAPDNAAITSDLDVNAAPVVDLNGATAGATSLAYTENGAAAAIAPAATVSDSDSPDFNTGTLTVAFTANGTTADRLTIEHQGTAAGEIGVAGSSVMFGGAAIGTFTGGEGGTPLVVTFNSAAATPAAAQALIEHIRYSNTSDTPSTAARTVTYTLVDGDGTAGGGADTSTETATVNVTPVDDAPTFSAGDGKLTTAVGLVHNAGFSVTLQPDGRILVAGHSSYGGDYDFGLARYNANGSLDTSFDTDGKLTTDVGTSDDFGRSMTLQPDGKILVAGSGFVGGANQFALARYNVDGSLDTSFDTDGKVTTDFGTVDDQGLSVTLQPDGRILIAGYSSNGSNHDFALARYNANGSLDTSFDTDGKLTTAFGTSDDEGQSVTLQPDGRILVAGLRSNGSGNEFALARYNVDGGLDTSFDADGRLTTAIGVHDAGFSVTLQPDGRILVAGYSVGSSVSDFALARYNTNGSLDTSFGGDGTVTTAFGTSNDQGHSVTLQPDGRILVAGFSSNGSDDDFALARYNVDGSLDTSFDTDGMLTTAIGTSNDRGHSVTLQPDGRILVAGLSFNGSANDFALARYNADGSLDTTFDAINTLDGAPAYAENGAAVVLDGDAQVFDAELAVLNGGIGNYAGATLTLERNGGASAQDVFGFDTAGASFTVSGGNLRAGGLTFATFTSADGTLTVSFTSSGTAATPALVNAVMQRITYENTSEAPSTSAAIDWRFSDGNGGDAQGTGGVLSTLGSTTVTITPVNDAPVLNDAKTPALGALSEDPGAPAGAVGTLISALVDLNPPAGGLNNVSDDDGVTGIALTALDARGSWYYTLNGGTDWLALSAVSEVSARLLAADADTRLYFEPALNFNGTLSEAITFRAWDQTSGANGGTADASVNGGETAFSSASDTAGITVNAVNDAPTFSAGDGKLTTVFGTSQDLGQSVTLQPDGKILVAGYSDSSGSNEFALARYNANGSLDTSFDTDGKLTTAFGTSQDLGQSVTVQPDGRILVAGHSNNGSNTDFALARYNVDGSLDTSFDTDGTLTTAIGTSDDSGFSVTLQPDGRILVAGRSNNGSNYDFALARYNVDGSLDTSFDGDGTVATDVGTSNDFGQSVTLQPDGRILVAGRSFNGSDYDFALARYNTDGSLDTSFDTDGKLTTSFGASTEGYSVTLQPDGKILVAGGSGNDFALARYNANGSLDTSFDTDGKVTTDFGTLDDQGFSVTLQPDGRILIAGFSSSASNYDFALVRYNANGSLDTSFDTDGKLTTDVGTSDDLGGSVTLQPDGRILVAGRSFNGSDDDFALARYNADGSLDTTFDAINTLDGAPTYTENGAAVVLDGDVRVFDVELAALNGGIGNYAGATLTLERNGGANAQDVFSFDTAGASFTMSGGNLRAGGLTFATFTSADGTLTVSFTSSGTAATPALVNAVMQRITYENTSEAPPVSVPIDWRFSDGNGGGAQGTGGVLSALGSTTVTVTRVNDAPVVDLNGATAGATSLAYTENGAAAAIAPAATVSDDSADFNAGTLTVAFTANGTTADRLTIEHQGTAAGQIGVAGSSVKFGGAAIGTFAGGEGGTPLVVTFNSAAATPAVAQALIEHIRYSNTSDTPSTAARTVTYTLVDGDGTAGGGADTATATATVNVTPVNDAPTFSAGDGKLTTGVGTSQDVGRSVTLQPDGRILVAGYSNLYDFALARYNTDGSLDTSFDTDGKLTTDFASAQDFGHSVTLQQDGRILVAGGSNSDFALARYNTNGSLDTSFDTDGKLTTAFGTSDDTGISVTLQPDGRILVAGSSLGGSAYKFALARYNVDGSLDTSFDTDGKVTTAVGTSEDYGRSVTLQPDGRILVAGSSLGSTNEFALARYNANGSLDTSFDTDGKLTTAIGGLDDAGFSVTLQPDGRILVAGRSYDGGVNDFALARYNADGSLDTSFDTDGKLTTDFGTSDDQGQSVTLQPDGRILVAGYSHNGSGNDFALARYNTNGSLDTSFDTDGKVTTAFGTLDDLGYSVTLQPDGRILVAGLSVNGSDEDIALARYNADGSLDTTFDAVNTLDGAPAYTENGAAVVLDGDVRVFDAELAAQGDYAGATLTLERNGGASAQDVFSFDTAGASFTVSGGNLRAGGLAFATFTSTGGTLTVTFTSSGTAATPALVNAVMQRITYESTSDAPPASVPIDWRFSDGNGGDAQGTGGVLSTLGSTTVTITPVNDAPVLNDAKTPALGALSEDPGAPAGAVGTLISALVDLNPPAGGLNNVSDDDGVTGIALTALDARGSWYYTLNGGTDWLALSAVSEVSARLLAADADTRLYFEPALNFNGTLSEAITFRAWDQTSGANGGTADASVNGGETAFSVASDTAGITVSAVNDAPTFSAGDGKLTTAFGTSGDEGRSVTLQPDGKILVAGGSDNDFALARYNANGSLDTSFDTDGKLTTAFGTSNDAGQSVTLQPDGRILVAGHSNNGSNTDFALARYNVDGSLDTSFDSDGTVISAIGPFDDAGFSVTVQPDGRILVAGRTYNGSDNDFALLRYDTNGSPDPSFGTSGTLVTAVGTSNDFGQSVTLQPDGRIVVAGYSHNGSANDFALVRYNTDGSPDTSFDTDGKLTTDFSTSDDRGNSVTLQPDGKILVAGGSGNDFALARYNANGSLDTSFDTDGKLTTDFSSSIDVGQSVTLQPDGRILVAGSSHNGSNYDFALARYNTDGSLDTSFDTDGKLTTGVGTSDDAGFSVTLQPDGRILVAGYSSGSNGSNRDFALARYNADGSLDTTFDAVNTLDGAPTYTENGAAVVLDGNVRVFDAELAAQGDYAGATLTLTRHGGANAQDVFSFDTAGASFAVSGGNLQAGGLTFATFTSAGGTLAVSFTSSGTEATPALVNEVMQRIAYANTSETPPASVPIDWSFSDGNGGGGQGTGGALSALGSTTVTVTAVNDAPTFSAGDGKLTTAFGTLDDVGFSVTLQPDGRILVAGYSQIGSNTDFALARYNADGSLDTSFDTDGKLTTDVGTSDDEGRSVTLQPDGKILVAGSSIIDSDFDFALARYNANGSLDTSFDGDGRRTTAFGTSHDIGNSVTLQPDGRILVAGSSYNGSAYDFALARYNTDGSLDTSFDTDGKLTTDFGSLNDDGQSVTLQPDGRILVAGSSHNGSNYDFALARYNTNGSLDTSFDGDGTVTTDVGTLSDIGQSVTLQPDGRILVAGRSYNGSDNDFALARYNTNGSLDTSFGTDGKLTTDFGSSIDNGQSVTLQPDGRILVAGHRYNGGGNDFALARYNTDGSLDTSFGTGGKRTTAFGLSTEGYSVTLQPDGRILVAGSGNDGYSDFALARYNADGSLDPTFHPVNTLDGAPTYTENGAAVVLDGDVRVFDAELAAQGDYAGATLTLERNGGASAQDVFSFDTAGASFTVSGGNLQAGGLTFATFTSAGGTLAVTFTSSGTAATPALVNAVMQRIAYANISETPPASVPIDWRFSDGNGGGAQGTGGVLSALGGTTVTVTAVNDAPTFSDGGTLTTDFGSSADEGRGVTLQPDGKILVAGSSYDGSTFEFALARYNANGSLDTSFDTDGKVKTVVGTSADEGRGVTLQPDGKILVAGYSFIGGDYDFALARYNANGSLDTSFDGDGRRTTAFGTSPDLGLSVTLQPDGKILVAGGSDNDFALARYNANGSLDTSFDTDGKVTTAFGSSDEFGQSVTLQPDGRILVAGYSHNGSNTDFALARYNTNGSLDTSFDTDGKLTTAIGTSDDVGFSVTLQPDGRILVAGRSYNGSNHDFALARYNANGSLDTSFDTDGKLTTAFGTSDDVGQSVTLQPDGRILVAGSSYDGSTNDFALARYNTDGSLDTGFGPGGKLVTDFGRSPDLGYSVTLQPDGKILVAGSSNISGYNDFALARYNADGSLDTTFDAINTLDGAPAYTENGAAVVLDGDVRVFDAELAAQGDYAGATLTLERNGGANAQDVFSFDTAGASFTVNGGDLQSATQTFATFTSAGGTLAVSFTSSGSAATPALVNEVMQRITYESTSDAPPASVPIDWSFSDGNGGGAQGTGGALSALGSTTVTVNPVNDAPVVDLNGATAGATSLAYTENGAAAAIAPAATVSDDSADFNAGTLTVAFTANGTTADRLTIEHQGTAAGQIGVAGSSVKFGGAAIGTFTGGEEGTPLVVTFNSAAATPAAAQALIEHIRYSNTSDVPSTAPRTVTYTLVDGDGTADGGTDTATATATVNVTAVNDAPTFSAGGKLTTAIGTSTDEGRIVTLQADGKILVAGLSLDGGGRDFALARYNANGSLDTSFDTDGKLTTDVGAADDEGRGVTLQPDGKILVAGWSDNGSDYDFALARYNANGSLDTSFDTDGKLTTDFGTLDDQGLSVTLQPDGRILVAGSSHNGSNNDFALARYNANGSLDTNFDTDGKLTTAFTVDDAGFSVTLQPDGRILVAGYGHNGSDSDFALARYNTNGSLDTSFDSDGKVATDFGSSNDRGQSMTLQPDGRILVAGFSTNGSNNDFALARYNTDGSLDTSFDTDGKLTTDLGSSIDDGQSVMLQPDGRILIAGSSFNGNDVDFALARYNTDGSLDTSFDTDGKLITAIGMSNDLGRSVTLQPDGKILVAGRSSNGSDDDFALARYNADGSLDRTFHPVNTLNGAPAYTENGAAVVLDGDVQVFDAELDAQGDYAGATLTLERNGGASAQDVFSFDTAGASFTVSGGNLQAGGLTFATFTSAGGTLAVTFTSSGTAATPALVNEVMQRIAYENTSDAPPSVAQINWTFSDGNSGAQGNGSLPAAVDSALTATGGTTVTINAVNDAPVNMVPTAQAVDEDTNLVFDLAHTNEIGAFDVDAAAGDNLRMTLHVDNGALNVRTDVAGGIGASQVTGDNTGTLVLTATQAELNTTLMADNGLVYKGDSNFSGNDTLTVTTNDLGRTGNDPGLTANGQSEEDTDTVAITVNAVDDSALPKAVLTIHHAASGTLERMNFDGLTYTAAHDLNVGPTWDVIGTRGDFNGDGQSDVVLRHAASGTVELMLMGELDYIATDDNAWGTAWQVVSTRGNYNGDGNSDIVLYNASTGTLEIMLMNGLDYSAVRDIEVGTGWVLADGQGDYDGNGKSDLLLRNAATGTLEIMLMDGTDYTAVRDFTPGTDWTVASGHDNLDGGDLKSDIILRHTPSGTLQLMLMDGTDYTATRNMTFSTDWQMASTGNDLNGDGKADLVMRHGPTGIAGLYLMDGLDYTAVLNKAYSTSLQIIDTAPDLNADGKTDLVLGNATTGLMQLSLMNGLAFTATQDYNFGAGWQVVV